MVCCVVGSFVFASERQEESEPRKHLPSVQYNKPNADQKSELFWYGTVTDQNGVVWNIRILPGASRAKRVLMDGWAHTRKRFRNLVSYEFYVNDVGEILRGSLKEVNRGAGWTETWLKTAFYHWPKEMFGGMGDAWKKAGKESSEAVQKGVMGWQLIPPWSVAKAVVKTIGYSIGLTAGTALCTAAAGVSVCYAAFSGTAGIAFSVGKIAFQPIAGIADIPVRGTFVPGAMFAWNCAAYLVAKTANVPQDEFFPFVVIGKNARGDGETPADVLEDFQARQRLHRRSAQDQDLAGLQEDQDGQDPDQEF